TAREPSRYRSRPHPRGRHDGGRGSPPLWPRRDNLRSLALRPGARQEARCLAQRAPFKDWLLPASLERLRRKLQGSDDGDRQMVKVLSAVLTDGLAAVEAACAEALADGVHSADVVLNILSRRRDPDPAITILTPDALRLQHLP